ncbi:MAG: phosphoribosylformylglycinamidine cyclo-ligase [Alphaproteobacteria bacterium GM7ARS4]|nr:phosphoribosylformylglycinamidine cyclo-ligase [Alphaproteobacteria bacterium GM7ARS4]
MPHTDASSAYRHAGVDTRKGQDFVSCIEPMAQATHNGLAETGALVLGGFGSVLDTSKIEDVDKSLGRNPFLVSCCDGVGTKLLLAQTPQHHQHIGMDVVAMCVNDIASMGGRPLFFLDYYACGQLDIESARHVLDGIRHACQACGCALVGGETAEMPGLYQKGHYDIAGFAVGAIPRYYHTKKPALQEGDTLLAFPSSGVHANGFSLIRRIIEEHAIDIDRPFLDGDTKSLREQLLTPTELYTTPCYALVRAGLAKGFAHITGGGLNENIPRMFSHEWKADINVKAWTIPPLQKALAQKARMDEEEWRHVFNSGIGMVAIVDANHVDKAKKHHPPAFEIGQITARKDGQEAVRYFHDNI